MFLVLECLFVVLVSTLVVLLCMFLFLVCMFVVIVSTLVVLVKTRVVLMCLFLVFVGVFACEAWLPVSFVSQSLAHVEMSFKLGHQRPNVWFY